MKILICGDSFSSDTNGWPKYLHDNVTNRSERGVGEFKIFQQTYDHKTFDKLIVCHTSPWRIHTTSHPLHKDNAQRPNNDFMIADLEHHSKHNDEIKHIYSYIKKYTDWDYVKFVYDMIVEKLLSLPNSIHITFHSPEDTKKITNNYHDVWQKYKGNINHLNQIGNEIVAKRIQTML